MKSLAIALAAGLALPFSTPFANATDYPFSLENCGRTIGFDAAPDRVVAVGQSTTELLYALGLGERVVGTAVWFNDVAEDYAEENEAAPRLADNDPSFESVVAAEPELVTTQFEVHVGPQGVVGTPEQFGELGIPVYAMPADCVGKDNTMVADGVRSTLFSLDLLYQSVREMAAIFDVEERGAELEGELRGRADAAIARAADVGAEGSSAVFWFSSAEMDIDPFVAGRNGIPAFIMNALGMRNVIETDEEWPTVGWETIAQADPDVIMIARMDRRRYAADDHEVKLEFLRSDPVAREMAAVKEGRIILVDAHAVHASTRLVDGMETIVEQISQTDLAE